MDTFTFTEKLFQKMKYLFDNRPKQYKDQILQDCFEMGILEAIRQICDFTTREMKKYGEEIKQTIPLANQEEK